MRRIFESVRRAGPGLRRCRKAIASVEFAIVLPVFLLMLFGIISFGSVLYLHNNMINAAREAARRLAVGAVDVAGAESYASTYLAAWGLAFTVAANDPDPDDPADVRVEISVPAASAALVGFPGVFDGATLQASVRMRKE